MQLPDGRNYPGWLCILIATRRRGGDRRRAGNDRREGRRAVVRRDAGRAADLAGSDPEGPRATRRDHHRGRLDQQCGDVLLLRERTAGSSPRSSPGPIALVESSGAIGQRRGGSGRSVRGCRSRSSSGVAVACFGTVAICNHATRPAACPAGTPLTVNCTQPLGLPLAAVLMLVFLVGLTFLAKRTTFGRHVYAVGGNAEAARRAGINVARVRILVFAISGIMAGVGGIVLAARLQSVNLQRRRRHAAARLDLGRRHRRREPVRRTRRGARRAPRLARHRDGRERPEHRRLLDRARSTS